jgi:hypothetical protein
MVSHRYDRLPLLSFDPGGVQRELVVPDLPSAKIHNFLLSATIQPICFLKKSDLYLYNYYF